MANRCSGCGKFVKNGSHSVFIPDSDRSCESLDFYCDPCHEDNTAMYKRIVLGRPDLRLVEVSGFASPQQGGESANG